MRVEWLRRTERLDRAGRWAKRFAWGMTAWLLGVRTGDIMRPLWGTPTPPTVHQVSVIVLLAVLAGALGGVLLIGRGWEGAVFATIIGASLWGLGFVGEIPTTRAVCGGDAVGGCDHVMGLWVVLAALAALLPLAMGLWAATGVWWLVRPVSRTVIEYPKPPLPPSPPATAEQIAWADFVARGRN